MRKRPFGVSVLWVPNSTLFETARTGWKNLGFDLLKIARTGWKNLGLDVLIIFRWRQYLLRALISIPPFERPWTQLNCCVRIQSPIFPCFSLGWSSSPLWNFDQTILKTKQIFSTTLDCTTSFITTKTWFQLRWRVTISWKRHNLQHVSLDLVGVIRSSTIPHPLSQWSQRDQFSRLNV